MYANLPRFLQNMIQVWQLGRMDWTAYCQSIYAKKNISECHEVDWHHLGKSSIEWHSMIMDTSTRAKTKFKKLMVFLAQRMILYGSYFGFCFGIPSYWTHLTENYWRMYLYMCCTNNRRDGRRPQPTFIRWKSGSKFYNSTPFFKQGYLNTGRIF